MRKGEGEKSTCQADQVLSSLFFSCCLSFLLEVDLYLGVGGGGEREKKGDHCKLLSKG